MPTSSQKPTALLRNIISPSYQLCVAAGNGKLTPEKVLVRCVLHTFDWLRARFRELECPPELICPPPEDSGSATFVDFKSFEISIGYEIEVVCLQDEKVWTLRLAEPDRGATRIDGSKRAPVAGRMIETNIAFRLTDSKIMCGFKTIISEPEDTDQVCEVFRYALVRTLALDEQIGLYHGAYSLRRELLPITSAKDTQKLAKWLRDDRRMLPSVLIVQPDTGDTEKPVPPLPDFTKLPLSSTRFTPALNLPQFIPQKKSEPGGNWTPDSKIVECWNFALGYAQVFALPANLIDDIKKAGFSCKSGDVLFIEPQFSGEVINIRGESGEQRQTRVMNYPTGKPVQYGNVMFVTEAKIVQLQTRIAGNSNREELLKDFELQKAAIRRDFEEKQRQRDLDFIALEKKLISERDRRESAETRNTDLLRSTEDLKDKHEREQSRKDMEIDYLRSKERRPKKPQEIASWAATRFDGQLTVFDSNKIKWNDVSDIDMLCDALEYLAMEYRGNLLGEISEDERNAISSVKYGRGFEVRPVTGTSTEVYHSDYHIKYGGTERLLDLHLRVGNKADNMLRIYFLYDKKQKLIVLGALPGHLPTVSYS